MENIFFRSFAPDFRPWTPLGSQSRVCPLPLYQIPGYAKSNQRLKSTQDDAESIKYKVQWYNVFAVFIERHTVRV